MHSSLLASVHITEFQTKEAGTCKLTESMMGKQHSFLFLKILIKNKAQSNQRLDWGVQRFDLTNISSYPL
jgi:hypothetical protein